MPSFYLCTVLKKENKQLYLNLHIINHQCNYFSLEKNFALQLILDPILQGKCLNPHLSKYVESNEDFENDNWILDHEELIIESADFQSLHYPINNVEYDSMNAEEKTIFWRDKSRIPLAMYNIEVVNEEFIAHLTTGMEWESAAYEL